MELYSLILVACWLVFIVYWGISAIGTKRTVRSKSYFWSLGVRIVLVIILIQAIERAELWKFTLPNLTGTSYTIAGFIGIIFAIAGTAFAIWARAYLGKNWGMPMTMKENRELVNTGPYKLVRHPIYSGILLAIFGSALVVGTWYFVFFLVMLVYFIFSARREEKMLSKELPDSYPEYVKHTKMIIPFVV